MNNKQSGWSETAKRRALWAGLLLVLTIAATYSNSLEGNWLFDDESYIVKEERIRSLWPPRFLVGTSRPVVYASLALNYAIGELNVTGYHVFNLACHILCALLLWHFLFRLLSLQRWGRHSRGYLVLLSLLPVLLWCLHPIQTMAVSYIWQRCELLMALVFLVALNALLLHLQGGAKSRWGIVCVATVWVGVMTKEVMVTFPLVALLFDYVFFSGSFRKIWRQRKLMYIGIFTSWIGLVFLMKVWGLAYHTNTDIGFTSDKYTPLGYMLVVPGVHLHYLKLLFYPVKLCFDYVWFPVRHWQEVVLPLVPVGALVVLSLLGVWRRKAWAWGILSYFIILAPTTSFMPMPDPVFEYRVYLPSAFLLSAVFLILCWTILKGLTPLWNRGDRLVRMLGLLVLALVLVFASMSHRRNLAYSSNYALWRRTLLVSPHNRRARYNMGVTCLRTKLGEEAEPHFRYLLEGDPGNGQYLYCLGLSLLYQGKMNRALTAFGASLESEGLKPVSRCENYFMMGHVLNQLGDGERARTALLKGRELLAREGVPGDPVWDQLSFRIEQLLHLLKD